LTPPKFWNSNVSDMPFSSFLYVFNAFGWQSGPPLFFCHFRPPVLFRNQPARKALDPFFYGLATNQTFLCVFFVVVFFPFSSCVFFSTFFANSQASLCGHPLFLFQFLLLMAGSSEFSPPDLIAPNRVSTPRPLYTP